MIVDNIIEGDSRVQKAAASVAGAGWEVLLLGRAPRGNHGDEFIIGRATARRVPVPYTLHTYRRLHPWGWRWPLAYRSNDQRLHGARKIQIQRTELRVRRAEARLARQAGAVGRLEKQLSRAEILTFMALGKIRDRWHGLRSRQFLSARRKRITPNGFTDNAVALFWQLLLRKRCWRKLEPLLLDYEHAFAPIIEQFEPDVIHAHDFRMVGVGMRAALRARANGRDVKAIYDAHEFLPGVPAETRRWKVANTAYEAEYAPQADAIITVSPRMAEMIRARHSLAESPTVVLNAPPVPDAGAGLDRDVRAACGLGPDIPLLVYAGGLAPARGLPTAVKGLAELPEVHLALVCVPNAAVSYAADLLSLAEELGVAERLHFLDPVAPADVPQFLSSADVAVHTMGHFLNHEVTLPNKIFEYVHAEIPVVVSDVKAMADVVRDTGIGEVFRAGDAASFGYEVRRVLADLDHYRSSYRQPSVRALMAEWTWETQEQSLIAVYDRLTDTGRTTPATFASSAAPRPVSREAPASS
jgi:glycosyltransferase involved in cell wall biosynthesis